MSNIDYERRKAVAGAWKNERILVSNGEGTRDWSKKEQREILAKGRATGYQGHHMKSVDGHNSKAGDPNNIQFLTRKEHLAAHNGDFHNNTNGYYDPATGEMHSFGRSKAHIEANSLSSPLRNSSKETTTKSPKSSRVDDTRTKAKATEARSVSKVDGSPRKTTVTAPQSKTLASQRSSKPSESRSNATKSKTLTAQRSSSTPKASSTGRSTSSGRSASSGKGSSRSGNSSGNGSGHKQ